MGKLYGLCMKIPGGVNGARTLRKRILNEMEKSPINGEIDLYFLEAGCSPEEIGNQTRSPIAHLAELPTVRAEHLEVVRAYFIAKKRGDLFTRMINAKNTIGYTALDYVQYMTENGKHVNSQRPHLGELINYLCANGGIYAHHKDKFCGVK